jgi:translation initiation factor 5B
LQTEILTDEINAQVTQALKAFRMKPVGVYVQASTLGSLEALLDFLQNEKIPVRCWVYFCIFIYFLQYCGINIGPVHKKDITKASTMLEHDSQLVFILNNN